MIILTRFKLHTIFRACSSLLDKYCEKEMCKIVFLLGCEGLLRDVAIKEILV